jgi:hypothetical protein
MTQPNELLRLARVAHANAEQYPDTKMSYWRVRNLYIDTLAHTLDIAYETAFEMVKDPDFRLPKKRIKG